MRHFYRENSPEAESIKISGVRVGGGLGAYYTTHVGKGNLLWIHYYIY